MSAADPTVAARSRRHRERNVAQASSVLELLVGIRDDVIALRNDVSTLRNAVDNAVDNLGAPSTSGRGQKRASVAQRSEPPNLSRARAYGEGAPPPTGAGGADVEDDAHRVLTVLVAPGSASSIRDVAELPLSRVMAALVHLADRGMVRREPGAAADRTDRWVPITRQEPALPLPPVLSVEGGEPMHVRCQDHAGHATTGHRWDRERRGFRCYVCEPDPAGSGPSSTLPAPDRPPTVRGGPRHLVASGARSNAP